MKVSGGHSPTTARTSPATCEKSVNSKILPADPRACYLAHKAEIDRALSGALENGRYILGPEVERFESEFAAYLGARHAIGVGSGTEALHLALRALGIGPGDRVITVSHTAVATVAAIELAGATPVLVDIDARSYTMDPNQLEAALNRTGGIKAVIPVHLYGRPASLPEILALSRKHGLKVIEDCCQSHGAEIEGRITGTWGDMAAFSFYPTKNLGALGDGGAVVTNDTLLAERVRLLREYGWKERYISSLQGMNSRLDEVQAAVLRVKLRFLDKENERRQSLAAMYSGKLAGSNLGLPESGQEGAHVFHQYVVRAARRDRLRDQLSSAGIGTLVHYPVPIHLQPAYRGRIAVGAGGLAETEKACGEILSLPMHPHLSDEDVHRVIAALLG